MTSVSANQLIFRLRGDYELSSTILVKSPEFGYGGIGIPTSKVVKSLLEENFRVCVHTTLRSKRIMDSQMTQALHNLKLEAIGRSLIGFYTFNPIFDLLSSMRVSGRLSLVLRPVPISYFYIPYIRMHRTAPELVIVHDCILDFREAVKTLKEKDFTEKLLLSPLGALMLKSEKTFLRRATKIVAVSKHTKRTLVCNYKIDPEKIVVVHNSVDINKFWKRKSSQIESEIGKEIQLFKKDSRLAVFVGRPQGGLKNLSLLFRVAKKMYKSCDLKFLIVGIEKERYSENQLQAMRRHNMLLTGYVPNALMPEIYSLSDLLIITSLNENLPNCLIEAMACGAIPISTKVGGVPEVIEDRRNGFLVNPDSAEDLESKLREILAFDEKTLHAISGRAQETVREKFADEIAKRAYINVINDVRACT